MDNIKEKKTKGQKATRIAILSFIGFVVIVVGLLGYGAYRYNTMWDRIHNELPGGSGPDGISGGGSVSPSEDDKDQLDKDSMKPMTVMIVGVDSRGEKHSRSDTMMLAAIHPQNKSVLLLSVPRDTYAYVEGVGYTKFNASMFYGGPALVEQTIENFLDIQVDRYVAVDFKGFRRIVNELGGIKVDVNRRMKYHDPADGTDIDLYPGVQVLDGEDALDYARFRLSDIGSASSDFERIERQHTVIRKVIDKANDIRNIFKIFSFMDIVGDHVRTDFTKDEIHSFYRTFHDFDSEKLKTISLHGQGDRKMIGGYNLWVYDISKEERERVHQIYQLFMEGKEIPDELLKK